MVNNGTEFDRLYWKYILKADIDGASTHAIMRTRQAKIYEAMEAMVREIVPVEKQDALFGSIYD